MKIGFILPILNAAEHLAGILAQVNDIGKTVVIEYTDPITDPLDSYNEKSYDDSYKIAEEFDGVDFISMGKVKDRCSAMNKGLRLLNEAEYIIMLQQGDFFLDIQYLIDELKSNDIISTRRIIFHESFGRYYLGVREEIAFKNIRKFGVLSYINDPFTITSPNGHALKEHNVRVVCIENILTNFKLITSKDKRERILFREVKEKTKFTYGIDAVRDLRIENIEKPLSKKIDKATSFLNLVPHPWKDRDSSFFDDLPTFPVISTEEWKKCFGDEYTSSFGNVVKMEKPRVLGMNAHHLASQFESEGWEYHTIPEGEFDMIYSVGEVPDINYVIAFLKEGGRIIIVDSKKMVNYSGYNIIFLRESNELFSFAIEKGNQNE